MNKHSFVYLAIVSTVILTCGSMVTNAFSSTSATVSYCPPICLDEVQQHAYDAKAALNDGKLIEATYELDIVSSLLDQLDDITSKPD